MKFEYPKFTSPLFGDTKDGHIQNSQGKNVAFVENHDTATGRANRRLIEAAPYMYLFLKQVIIGFHDKPAFKDMFANAYQLVEYVDGEWEENKWQE